MSAGSQCRGRDLRRDNRDTGAGSAPTREKESTLNTAEPVKLTPSSANLGRIFLLPASPRLPRPRREGCNPE